MSEQWVKYFQKQTQKTQDRIEWVLDAIKSNEQGGLDIKELKGYNGIYRVRIGDLRLIYRNNSGGVEVLYLGSRGDVYKKFRL